MEGEGEVWFWKRVRRGSSHDNEREVHCIATPSKQTSNVGEIFQRGRLPLGETHCAKTFTAQEMCKRTDQAVFYPDAPVGGDIFWKPETSDSLAVEGTNGGVCYVVTEGHGFGPVG